MSKQAVLVPDIGSDEADVIEILVKVGDSVEAEQSVIVLESAKASMEMPCPVAGTVADIAVKIGQTIKQGDLVMHVEAAGASAAAPAEKPADVPVAAIKEELQQVSTVLTPPASAPAASAPAASGGVQLVKVPDIGSDSADVIEILVKVGDRIELEQSIFVLESAKASMEVPNTVAGEVQRILVNVGDSVSESTVLLEVLSSAPAAAAAPVTAPAPVAAAPASAPAAPSRPVAIANETLKALATAVSVASNGHNVHAGPAVRRLARELGADLSKIKGTGPRNRILKEDVHAFVKQALSEAAKKKDSGSGFGLPALPAMDFSKWGEIERVELTKIQKVSAQNLHRSWITIPHVTQFDEADITDLEAFRVAQKDAMKAQGLSLTILAFLVKASAHVLKQYPKFASSLDVDGAHLIQKKYIHIGVAVDTPNGLVVPVIRDADKKSVSDIVRDLGELSKKARDKKLTPADMQGAVFSISSLGGIGGTAFTPIVNWPEVAILGVSRSSTKPVWDGKAFQPRLMLPLSLSYDHRVIDGADAARFTTALAKVLSDIRQVLL
ncbi:MAG: dihydrolipoyllysine-residue acetyltransferase [Pedobacter sp.]|nr:dihydrolipoyllysine-residue acetyltransferase [Pedobacter sp.]